MSSNIHLSIILPVYNSQAFLLRSLDSLDAFIAVLPYSTELIIVDDGSKDNSRSIADKWASEKRPYPVRVIAYGENHGKGGAVATGMLAATGTYRVFLDADLAYDPTQIERIVEALEKGADVAVASRVHPESHYTISPAFFHYLYTRHMASRLINWFIRHTIIPDCSDSQAGLKGFRAEAAREIFSRQKIRGFSFDIEALYLAEKMGFKIKEVAVDYRYFNEPTTVVFLKDGLGLGRDIFQIYMNFIRGRYWIPAKGSSKKLIINADDFGMTLPISRGILKAAQTGAVTAASVMTNSPEFEAAMGELKESDVELDVGFHATLTWGRPILDPKEIPTLVNDRGKFHSKLEFLIRIFFGKISEEEAYLELEAQCKKLAAFWPVVSHMDGHHHIHTFPVVSSAAARVARKFGIRFVRANKEGLWSPWFLAPQRRWPAYFFRAASPAFWRAKGFETADNFGGFALGSGPNLKERWMDTFGCLPGGVSEIMAHPGYVSENKDGYNKGREDELTVLTDPDFIGAAKRAGVEFTTFIANLRD